VVNRATVSYRKREEEQEAIYEDTVDRFKRPVKYAVLTRRPSRRKGLTVTMIGVNNGKASEGTADYLTREAESLRTGIFPKPFRFYSR